ncbi:MAG: iron ABC transporter permease, partial [Candidatus Cloacimonetes bacterium]|nr:iron ABC transporter permease [Candidatus Cloacimonadota bacterium]
ALGSILAALTGMIILMPLWGFAGALSAIILVWSLAGLGGFLNKTRLILAGIIIGLFLSAVISLLMYFNQQDIGIIINVLMGNLGRIFSNSEWPVFLGIFIIANLLILYLFSLSRQLSILASGDLIAASLGIKAKVLRRNIFLVGSLLTGMTVAYAGIIGFVGLVIPHLTRIIFRNQSMSLIYSAFLGGFFLIFCDLLAQHLTIVEIPVGIITAFIGCPFFLLIMLRNK